MSVLYSIKKSLLYNAQQFPIAVIPHKSFWGMRYYVEFTRYNQLIYYRFIIPQGNDLFTTSKFFVATTTFENNEQLVYKVIRTKEVEFGMQIVNKDFLIDHTVQKKRLKPHTFLEVFHPRKYLIGFSATEDLSNVISNLSSCK